MASIRKLPSGKWRCRVRVRGAYRGETFGSKQAAREWATSIEGQLLSDARGQRRRVKGLTIGDIVEMYIDEVINVPGARAGKTKRNTLAMLADRLATVEPDGLEAALDRFIVGRQKDGAGGVTISADLSFLSTVLQWAASPAIKNIDVDEQAPKRARASLKLRGLETRSRERDRLPTEDELARLYSHWDTNPRQRIPMTAITKFAIATALRQEEIARVRIEEIDWDRGTVWVRERKHPTEKETNDQEVPLIGDALQLAREAAGDRNSGRLFPYNPNSVSAAFTRACKKLQIKDLHFHDTRHAATTAFFKMNLPIQLVAKCTGHYDWKNLKRYTELTADDVHAELERLRG